MKQLDVASVSHIKPVNPERNKGNTDQVAGDGLNSGDGMIEDYQTERNH
jgi:hypothetical protein